MGWTLVTGGAKRLGAEICTTLAKQGHDILVHYNTSQKEALEVVAACRKQGVKAACIQGDFTSTASTQHFLNTLLKNYPDIHHLVNNIGNYLVASGLNTSEDDWQTLFQTNFHAPNACIQALLPSLKHAKGSIINIGVSGIDNLRANTHHTAFSITKTSLLLLTKSLARELAPFGIRINMVSPGYLDLSVDIPKDPTTIPMHRLGTSAEVARVVAFLLNKENSYITGQNIEVAGGVGL